MTTIINTSKFIEVLYENELEEDESVDRKNFFNKSLIESFMLYKSSNEVDLNIKDINIYLNVFQEMNLHDNFVMPEPQEYFNKKYNYLLLIDFLLSFQKADKKNIISEMSTANIERFFIKLSHIYNFMDYLDVDEKFLKYIKALLTLYVQSFDRKDIEEKFGHIVWKLDYFFKNEVISNMFFKNKDKSFSSANDVDKLNVRDIYYEKNKPTTDRKRNIETHFSTIIEKYISEKEKGINVDYLSSKYDFLNKLFKLNTEWSKFDLKRKCINEQDRTNFEDKIVFQRYYTDNDLDNDDDDNNDNNDNNVNNNYDDIGYNPNYDSDNDNDIDIRRAEIIEGYGTNNIEASSYMLEINQDYGIELYFISEDTPSYESNYVAPFIIQEYEKEINKIEEGVNLFKNVEIKIKDFSELKKYQNHPKFGASIKNILVFVGERIDSYLIDNSYDAYKWHFSSSHHWDTAYEMLHVNVLEDIIDKHIQDKNYKGNMRLKNDFGTEELTNYLYNKYSKPFKGVTLFSKSNLEELKREKVCYNIVMK